jgi:hypothetical protein
VASEVDICNAALGNLGDVANLQSINPPDGSAQADHCSRFYPIARDAMIEMHDWDFATKRVVLAQVTNITSEWAYCYAQPVDLLNTIAVMDPLAGDDWSVGMPAEQIWQESPVSNTGAYTPREFVLESAADGTDILYTNQVNAVLRYTARVTDTSKFSPLFIRALIASLSSLLAGPIVKGEAGAAAAERWEMVAFGRDGRSGWFGRAASSDAGQRRSTLRDRPAVSWINAR